MKKFRFDNFHLHLNKSRFFGKREMLERDWRIVRGLFGAIILFWIFIALYLFFKIRTEEIFIVETNGSDVSSSEFNERDLFEALEEVRTMQVEFEGLRSTGSSQ